MKVLAFTIYGSPSQVLHLSERPKPVPKEKEVLVKVHATAVNDYDWSMIRGTPFVYRAMFGWRKPKTQIPGMELSGTVEATGPKTTSFKVGDEVYGDISDVGFGTFAEYVAVEEKALVHKPEKMSFEEAAAISHASMLAYQGLIDVGNIQNGQKILINGAGGGVGTFGLQIAKLYDAEVTGVDTGEKLQMMQSIGFDHIIDYKKEDFTKNGQQYDLVLDTKTNRAPLTYLRALRPGGKYVTVGGKLQLLFRMLLAGFLMKTISSKSLQILALKPNKDLEAIHQLFKAGKLKVVMDGPYPLEKGPEIVQYFGEGLHQGKVILSPLIKTT